MTLKLEEGNSLDESLASLDNLTLMMNSFASQKNSQVFSRGECTDVCEYSKERNSLSSAYVCLLASTPLMLVLKALKNKCLQTV